MWITRAAFVTLALLGCSVTEAFAATVNRSPSPLHPPLTDNNGRMMWKRKRKPSAFLLGRKKSQEQLSSQGTERYNSAAADSALEEGPTMQNGSDETVADSDTDSGGSSVAAATFGLVKCMVGSGMLALPGGLAAVSNYRGALWPANVLLLVLGTLSAYTFSLYGRLVDQTQAKSLGDLWKKVQKTNDSFIVSMSSFLYCFGCLVTFGLVIGDAMSSLAVAGGLTGWMASRHAAILAVTAGALYPLCNLSSLAALAPVSVVGVLGTLVTTGFVALRCPAVVASSPYAAAGLFSTFSRTRSPAPLIMVAMGCTSLMAHFSTPDFYHSLVDKPSVITADDTAIDAVDATLPQTDKGATLKKFTTVTVGSFIAVTLLNMLTMSFGFLTFGGNSAGIILNNYSARDIGAVLSRFLVAVSVIGGYPFLMTACRSEAHELFRKGKPITKAVERKTTSILLVVLTALCMVVKDAGFVVSFNGALMGTALIYIFPTLMFLKQTSQGTSTRSVRLERAFCKFLVGFGCVSSLIGAATSVLNSYFPHLLQ
jgi:sodium-coupled neutral amino acid transporter 11